MSEISQFHDLANVCRKLDKSVEISADAIICLDDEIAELERVLRMYPEWKYSKGSFGIQFCPICGCNRSDGHSDDCPRMRVLGE